MKRLALLIGMLICFVAHAPAQTKGFGLGVILGEPTGFSGKYWLSSRVALDGGLAWSFTKESSLHMHVDYVWHMFDALKTEDETIPMYVGLGGRVKFGNNEQGRLGIRIVGGIDFMIYTVPMDVFLEIAPIVNLIPSTQASLNGGLGARFFFRQ